MSDYQQTLHKAQKHIINLELDAALDLLYGLLQKFPADMPLVLRIVRLELRRNNSEKTLDLLNHILAYHPQSISESDAFNLLWQQYQRTKQCLPAIKLDLIMPFIKHADYRTYASAMHQFYLQVLQQHAESELAAMIILAYGEKLVANKQHLKAIPVLQKLLYDYADKQISARAQQLLSKIKTTQG